MGYAMVTVVACGIPITLFMHCLSKRCGWRDSGHNYDFNTEEGGFRRSSSTNNTGENPTFVPKGRAQQAREEIEAMEELNEVSFRNVSNNGIAEHGIRWAIRHVLELGVRV